MDKRKKINNIDELYITIYNEINCLDEQKKIKIAQAISHIISLSNLLVYYLSFTKFKEEIDEIKLAQLLNVLNNDFKINIKTDLLQDISDGNTVGQNTNNSIVLNYACQLNDHEYICYTSFSTMAQLQLNNYIDCFYERTSQTLTREDDLINLFKNDTCIIDPIRLNAKVLNCDLNNRTLAIDINSNVGCIRGRAIFSALASLYLSNTDNNMSNKYVCVIISDYDLETINGYTKVPQYIYRATQNEFDETSFSLAAQILNSNKLNDLVKNKIYFKTRNSAQNSIRDFSLNKITFSGLARAIYRYFTPCKEEAERNNQIVNFIIDFYNEFAKINKELFESSANQSGINYAPLRTFGIECEIYFCSLLLNHNSMDVRSEILKYNHVFENAPDKISATTEKVRKYVDEVMANV